MNRSRAIPLGLAAACYLLAFVQRPGLVYADTKVDLYVDPVRFLADVAAAWTDQGQLGHVFSGQYGGYLFPMAPWFALGDLAGAPTWIVHRLWLGTVLAVAAWGVVRLLDALLDRARGAPHVAAAVLFVLNPYVAVYANRTSITLLAYAALPWLLLAVHRGLREPRAWRWPAIFALALTCTGGGVNVAVTGWVLLGPALFVAYERLVGGVGRGAIVPFVLRLAPVVLVANLWWLAPVVVHMRYGLDFLAFTEQPGTIWQTTSVTESLRLTGFWTSYIGLGFGGEVRPFASHAAALGFFWPVLVASLLVPAIVLGGFAWTRRWRYGPWFCLLALTGLVVMVAGFPEGTPLRRALTFTYNHAEPLRFLRTTYKAGPLLALGLACLGGGLAGVAWDRLHGRRRALAAAGAAALCAVAAWPLTSGRAPEPQLALDVPYWWHAAEREVAAMPPGQRAMVLPGRLFAYYDWGGTVDPPILPALADRPVAERLLVPFADLRAVDLQFAADALVSQERLLPGQLAPLLDLMGVGRLVVSADDDRSRSGAVGPVEARDMLARDPRVSLRGGRGRAIGPRLREPAAAGRVRDGERLPRIETRALPTGGLVRVLPRGPLTVLDGGGEGVASLAGFGALDPGRPLAYAADLDAGAIRRAAAAGGEVVVTDTNRRQAFVAARLRANRGPVLQASEELSEDGAMLDPFGRGPDAQTVAELEGIARVHAPASPQTPQLPEHRPFAVLDGDPATAWLADRALALERHWVEVRFSAPRDVPYVDVLPYGDERGRVLDLEVNGRRVRPGPGWTRVRLDARGEDAVRVRVLDVSRPPEVSGGAGGIRELRIPGVRAREWLRPPVLAERALRGRPVRGGLSYLLSRVTADAPHRTAPPVGPFQAYRPRDRVDPEPRLLRAIAPPVARRWAIDAWTSPGPATPDPRLDRLAGTTGTTAWSSRRFGGLAAHRASRALDGDPATAWIAPWVDQGRGAPAPRATISVRLDAPATVRRLRLVPPAQRVRRATRVRVAAGGEITAPLAVAGDGTVALPAPLRGRTVAVEVLDAAFAPGTPGRVRQTRAVGVAALEGIPGARVRDAAPGARLAGSCGDAAVGTAAGVVALRVAGGVRALERGEPLRARACGPPPALPAGRQVVEGAGGPLRADHVRLRSEGGAAAAAPAAAGRVLDQGDGGRGERDGVRVEVAAPGWLVLGQGVNAGWRATCDGRDLGAPRPLQGFANAWPVEPGCREVRFAWAPGALLLPGYLISLVACLVLLAVLLAGRRRAPAPTGPHPPLPDGGPPVRWPLRRALAGGLVAALVLGFVFALRAGVVLGPLVAVVLALGIPARRLALAGGVLLGTVVPVLYLAVPVRAPAGFNSNAAVDRIAAHWVGVLAVTLLLLALGRALAAARRGD